MHGQSQRQFLSLAVARRKFEQVLILVATAKVDRARLKLLMQIRFGQNRGQVAIGSRGSARNLDEQVVPDSRGQRFIVVRVRSDPRHAKLRPRITRNLIEIGLEAANLAADRVGADFSALLLTARLFGLFRSFSAAMEHPDRLWNLFLQLLPRWRKILAAHVLEIVLSAFFAMI